MTLPLLKLHLLGHFRLFYGEKPLPFNTLPKTLPLLAYLLLHRGLIPRDVLAYTFWPDVEEAEARANLRRHLYNLRHVLPEFAGEWVTREGQALQWNPNAPYWLDVEAFERYGREPSRMQDALSLYTGDLLPEVYEDWLDFDRQRLRSLYFSTAAQWIAAQRVAHRYDTAIPIAEQALRQDPWREDILRELIQLRVLSGDRTGALQAYQTFKKQLEEELDVAPMPETVRLYEQIQRGGLEVGEPDSPPPLRTPAALPVSPPGRVPVPLKPIIGREIEITTLLNLLSQEAAPTRLLTLIGTAGTGKTRLALEVASRLLHERPDVFPDGVFFIPLASLTRADLVLPSIAAAMGVKVQEVSGMVQSLVNDFRYKKVLLVLDNLEHVLDAAPALGELLSAAAGLWVLGTSQAALRLYGEREYPVRPLGLPDIARLPPLEILAAYPSVALFVETARATNPNFVLDAANGESVAHICARLDGLPLAIELAAARTRIFSPAGLLDQLAARFEILTSRSRDVPERHRTLRSAVEWSYNLMAEEEKKLFARLAIFPGGFSAETVGAVLMTPETSHLALDVLELLAEKNVIQPDLANKSEPPRFLMLATLRDYALERLQADDELPVLYKRRAAYYAHLAEQADDALFGAEQGRWLVWIQAEENNLRATLEWAFQPEQEAEAVEMGTQIICLALNRFWRMRGRLNEGQEWFARARTYADKLSRKYQKKLAQQSAGFYVWQGEYELAKKYYEMEYELAQADGELKARMNLLQGLGLVAGHVGAFEEAEKYLVEAVALEREHAAGQQPYNLLVGLNNLGIVYRHLGNYARAIELQQEVLAYRLALGDEWGRASVLANIGILEGLLGQYEASLTHYQESMQIRQRLGDDLGIVICLAGVAGLMVRTAAYAEAVRLFGVIWKLREQFNFKASLENRLEEERDLAFLRRQLGDTAFAACWEEGTRWTLSQAMACVWRDAL